MREFVLSAQTSIAELSHINNYVIELPRAVPSRAVWFPGHSNTIPRSVSRKENSICISQLWSELPEIPEQKYAQHIKVPDIWFFFFKKKVTDQSELSSEMKDSNI